MGVGVGRAAPGGSADLFQDPSITWSNSALRSQLPPPITMETVRSSRGWADVPGSFKASTLLIRSEAEPKLKRKRA